jgi:hypothetical protein
MPLFCCPYKSTAPGVGKRVSINIVDFTVSKLMRFSTLRTSNYAFWLLNSATTDGAIDWNTSAYTVQVCSSVDKRH